MYKNGSLTSDFKQKESYKAEVLIKMPSLFYQRNSNNRKNERKIKTASNFVSRLLKKNLNEK